jgi:hypothetical protein
MAKSGREEAQATYIASETLDTMRLYSWNQLTNAAFMPSTFSVTYGGGGLEWNYNSPRSEPAPQPLGITTLLANPGKSLKNVLKSKGTPESAPTSQPASGGASNKPSEPPVQRTGRAYEDLVFRGTLDVTDAPVSEGYGSQIKMLTVTLEWESSGRKKQATMSTFFTRFGLQGQLIN